MALNTSETRLSINVRAILLDGIRMYMCSFECSMNYKTMCNFSAT